MQRTLIIKTKQKVGQKVKITGWVKSIRSHGKVVFLDLLDRSGVVQVVASLDLAQRLKDEYVVEIQGLVKKRPKEMVNPHLETGSIEIEAKKLNILAQSALLPFDINKPELKVNLPTLLDYQPLTLRHRKNKAIFKIQEGIIQSFRQTMKKLDFTEFNGPTIVPVATEGGAEVFKIKYYNYDAYLAQSPQLYKQILVGVFERVFTVTHAYRAEPSTTTRHISEYISLDAEMGFIESWLDLIRVVERVMKDIFLYLQERYSSALKEHNVKLPRIKDSIPRLKLKEAQEIIFQRTKRNNRKKMDLEPEDEREICKWAEEEYGLDLIFITHYPTLKRPFYTHPDPEDPTYTLSFDLLFRGLEIVTGGQRIYKYKDLVKNIQKWGNRPEDFELYLQAFKYGMPPEGGFALGAERITKQLLNLDNIRQAALFPRDMERIDQRLKLIKR